MNLLDAARHLVRRFPGGIECLAIRLGKRASTLRHEVAGSDAYKLGLQDAELITHLNAAAQAKRYDTIGAAALRAGYPGPFHDEGVAFATWMDAIYAKCYEVLAKVQADEMPEPTLEHRRARGGPCQIPTGECRCLRNEAGRAGRP